MQSNKLQNVVNFTELVLGLFFCLIHNELKKIQEKNLQKSEHDGNDQL